VHISLFDVNSKLLCVLLVAFEYFGGNTYNKLPNKKDWLIFKYEI